jgi:surface antigen
VRAARLAKALLVPATLFAGLAAPLLASSPAEAASCVKDPYNNACVKTVTYTARPGGRTLAVQRKPKTGSVRRYVRKSSKLSIVCQVNNGGTANRRASHTWDALAGGGWVYNADTNAPAPGADGFSPGIRHCGVNPVPTRSPAPASTGPVGGFNPASYPWQNQNGWFDDQHGYYEGECVSFAAWAVRVDGLGHTSSPDFHGNANQWTAPVVDSAPRVGDVAQWDAWHSGAGSVGHVAYVVAVGSGTVTIDEYNWAGFHKFGTRTIGTNNPSRYLHY